MIVVPVDSSFGHKASAEQHSFIRDLQQHAAEAGLKGTVVPVWNGGFIAPRPWHPFFRTLPLHLVHANINKEIYW